MDRKRNVGLEKEPRKKGGAQNMKFEPWSQRSSPRGIVAKEKGKNRARGEKILKPVVANSILKQGEGFLL